MIVVINPSGGAGHSFKGLHAYCSHDQGSDNTAERVDWIETRNIANDDPANGWKIMAATAKAQNELKRAAEVKPGRPSKHGAVMHVVLSFDEDEPKDKKDMLAAADEFLSALGVDPAKMRAKNKPKRRQFADEHQVVMYAHTDTKSRHIHLMINRVHPQTGVNLPSNNDQVKASKWALEYSKRMGTDHKTPARAENMADRDAGEYVKGARRKSRNAYEMDKAAEAHNDNHIVADMLASQRKKDQALALRGRNMAKLHAAARDRLAKNHLERKASLGRKLQTQINKARAQVREEFRPKWRALPVRQAKERETFAALESTFFGRAGNVFKALQLSAHDIQGDSSGVIGRSFKVITNASERKAYFERAQEREISALRAQEANGLSEAKKSLKAAHSEKMADLRVDFAQGRKNLEISHASDTAKLKADWKNRTAERDLAFKTAGLRTNFADNASPAPDPTRENSRSILDRYAGLADSRALARDPAKEQDNDPGRGD